MLELVLFLIFFFFSKFDARLQELKSQTQTVVVLSCYLGTFYMTMMMMMWWLCRSAAPSLWTSASPDEQCAFRREERQGRNIVLAPCSAFRSVVASFLHHLGLSLFSRFSEVLSFVNSNRWTVVRR